MIGIKFSNFFDRAAVTSRIKPATRAILSKAGAFVRTRARSSIRPAPRKYTPTPGKPPRSHTRRLRDLIFFAYDAIRDSVYIGPLLFRSRRSAGGPQTGPELLEFGGKTTDYRGRPATYRKFPYMAPALEAEAPKFPTLFQDAIK